MQIQETRLHPMTGKYFQVMFVSVLNVILVLICHAIFSKSTVLNIVLTIMSACTYVMIASSALRMTMYIKAYDLTYMRILVFAALAVLAVVLAGVIVRIYADRFPLVRYSMFVIVTVYIIILSRHIVIYDELIYFFRSVCTE